VIFDYLFLPVLFFIAGVAAWQDFKFGKIRNKWIIRGLVYGLAVFLIFFLWDLAAAPASRFFYLKILHRAADAPLPVFTVSFNYLKAAFINFLIAIPVGFLMWRFRAWSAGDAKLFFVFALLLPLNYYEQSYLPFFPAFALLGNIFIPVFVYFSAKALFFSIKILVKKARQGGLFAQALKDPKKKIISFFKLLLTFLIIFFFSQMLRLYFSALDFDSFFNQVVVLFAAFLLSRPLAKLLKNNQAVAGAAGVLVLAIGWGAVKFPDVLVAMLWQTFYLAVIFLIVIGALRYLLNFYIREREVQAIGVGELKKSCQICQHELEKIKKESPVIFKRVSENGGRLGEEELGLLKEFYRQKDQKTVDVYKSFPFGVWMAAGLALTVILRGSLLSLLARIVII